MESIATWLNLLLKMVALIVKIFAAIIVHERLRTCQKERSHSMTRIDHIIIILKS